MAHEDVMACVTGADLPCVHMAWPVGSAPEPPWCAFYEDDTDGFHADDHAYARRVTWAVELIQRWRDSSVEAALEEAILAAFGPFEKTESWDGSEQCLVTVYRFTEIERNDNV